MRTICLFFIFCSALLRADFRQEFLDEVLAFAKLNPVGIMEEECKTIEVFRSISLLKRSGSDQEIRPVFVSAQGDFEKTMALFLQKKKIKELFAIIHTPTPATPLCTEGTISPTLVDKEIQGDPMRLYTIKKRPEIVRDFLEKGGILVVAYPESGRAKRTDEELAIFENVKKRFPKNLIDKPLPMITIKAEYIGATYIFKTESEEQFAFAIMINQANAPIDNSTCALWFGSLNDPSVYERVAFIFNAFLQNDEIYPKLRSSL